MKKTILILFAIMLSFNVFAENMPQPKPRPDSILPTQLLLNMTIPCREDGVMYISETVQTYGEQEFASGIATIKPLTKLNLQTVDLLMYVSPDRRSFTIFTLQNVGNYEVACILAGGHTFKPFTGEYRSND